MLCPPFQDLQDLPGLCPPFPAQPDLLDQPVPPGQPVRRLDPLVPQDLPDLLVLRLPWLVLRVPRVQPVLQVLQVLQDLLVLPVAPERAVTTAAC